MPVAELMIGQIQQPTAMKPQKSTAVVLDDKSILDTVTGIKYTKVNTWAGQNDVIKTAGSITGISPTGKFLLADHTVVLFDNTNFLKLFDPLDSPIKSRLSPDGSRVAFITENGISQIPVSPETGRPTGSAQKLYTFDQLIYNSYDLNWSLDGKTLIFSLVGEDQKAGLSTLSIKDGILKKVLNSTQYNSYHPVFSKNGMNNLYFVNGNVILKSSITGKSVVIIDSLYGYKIKTAMSPDDQWLIYNKTTDAQYLFRLEDKQKCELSAPEEVGEFVSWANEANKIIYYHSSYDDQSLLKVISVYGGPSLEYGIQYGDYPKIWTPDCKSIVAVKRENIKDFFGKTSLNMINLYDQEAKPIEGITDFNNFTISPDFTKILVHHIIKGKLTPLYVLPFSWKNCRVTGKAISIIKDYSGFLKDDMWSPDGKKIAAALNGNIWIYDAEGEARQQLTKGNTLVWFFKWSPDGNALAVKFRNTNQLQIIKSSNGEVLHTFDKIESFDWTRDGKEITIAFSDGQINSIVLASGKSRKIANWKEISRSFSLNELS